MRWQRRRWRGGWERRWWRGRWWRRVRERAGEVHRPAVLHALHRLVEHEYSYLDTILSLRSCEQLHNILDGLLRRRTSHRDRQKIVKKANDVIGRAEISGGGWRVAVAAVIVVAAVAAARCCGCPTRAGCGGWLMGRRGRRVGGWPQRWQWWQQRWKRQRRRWR